MTRHLKIFVICSLAVSFFVSCGKEDPGKDQGKEQKEDQGNQQEKVSTRTEFDLSLMTFNIAVDNRTAETGWDARKAAVTKMLNTVKPTLIGLQEAQAHEITYIAKFVQKYLRYGLGRDNALPPKIQDEYDAEETMLILWHTDSLEAVEKGTFWLSEHPEKPGLGWDASYNRNVNWIHFRHKVTKQEFFFFNTHLDNKGKTARTESIKLIDARMKELNPDGLPVFLSADFNVKQNNKIFAPINEWMVSTRDAAPESDTDKMTYNGYVEPKSQIDHIFFYEGKDKKVTPLTFRVLDGDYGAAWLSDHYPVVATYRLKK